MTSAQTSDDVGSTIEPTSSLHSKIVLVWIDRFCARYDWWRRLQPTSSVSPVCSTPAHCSCAQSEHRQHCTHISRWFFCAQIPQSKQSQSFIDASFDLVGFVLRLFFFCITTRYKPISSWSTSRSNRPNATNFPGCSQSFLAQGLF